MLTTRSASHAPDTTVGACRARRRNLAVVLRTALATRGAPTPTRLVRYAAQVFDDRRTPVLASSGDLTPYVAEILADEVLRASHGSRVDLFVEPEAGAALRSLTRRIERIADGGLDIRVHDSSEDLVVC